MKEIFKNEQEPVLTKEIVQKVLRGEWDKTFDWIAEKLNVKSIEAKKKLKKILDELVEKEWLSESEIVGGGPNEYDPGPEQEESFS